jgi:two-component system, NarL family, response regulator LiaR
MRRKKGAPLLTERETEVLRLIAQGHTNQEIADTLIIEKRTVVNHIRSIRVKLDSICIKSQQRVQLATYALKTKLISLDEIDVGIVN